LHFVGRGGRRTYANQAADSVLMKRRGITELLKTARKLAIVLGEEWSLSMLACWRANFI
jgi:hypothetical protein